jgi:hypothetical protein
MAEPYDGRPAEEFDRGPEEEGETLLTIAYHETGW